MSLCGVLSLRNRSEDVGEEIAEGGWDDRLFAVGAAMGRFCGSVPNIKHVDIDVNIYVVMITCISRSYFKVIFMGNNYVYKVTYRVCPSDHMWKCRYRFVKIPAKAS